MGIPSTMRDAWANRRNSPLIASPAEDQKILNSRRCTQEGVRAGVKAASIACVGSAVPTLESADLVILEEEDDATSVSVGSEALDQLRVGTRRVVADLGAKDQAQIDLDAKKLQSYVKEKSLISEKGILADKISPGVLRSRVPNRQTKMRDNSLGSLWDYTNIVMNFLCGPQTLDSCSTLNFEWLRFFNVVITGSAKQSFFHDENRANLYEVEPASRTLLNTDNGTPMPQVGGALRLPLKSLNKSCKVFQVISYFYYKSTLGGNVGHLHKLLGIESSSQVLYVGDHIYGDILRSKKVLVHVL
ncbi:hypothetical protein LOK49_LG13G02698 [Camellia lanceoleosa]|uniref:Uncharacterized protein n=1 Tax=Camellia lanceoleosa TaxID=1840588 RepID=A0ACC0FJD8_9ERIC|nr:hypothetical protein LOK49_LG13G02698 [Camellia lanceoleosa]